MAALFLVGCGARTAAPPPPTPVASVPQPKAHPQAVDPVAGAVAPNASGSSKPKLPAAVAGHPSGPPLSPASDTAAPAVGAPTDAEVRAAVAKFQAAKRRYHLDQLNLSGDIIDPSTLTPGHFYTSIASVFTDYGLPIACGGDLAVSRLGVANKTLPCGTWVTFVYGNRAIRVQVIDRGPYIAGREWDLTGAAAEALNFPGLGPIQWRLG